MQINLLNIIRYIPLIFYFLPALCIPIFGKAFPLFILILAICLSMFLILNFTKNYNYFYFLYKNTSFKYICYWLLYCFISFFILLMLKLFTIGNCLYYLILFFVFSIIYPLIYPILIFKTRRLFITFIKILISASYIILILALINFIANVYSLNFIHNIYAYFLATKRTILNGIGSTILYTPRVCSVFSEPGWLGRFLCCNLPIYYSLTSSSCKIFKNNIINLIIKKSLILLTWCAIFLTLSPIWLVFSIIITILYYYKSIIKVIKKYSLPIIISIILLFSSVLTSLSQINIEKKLETSYLNRIIKVLSSDGLNILVYAEPSLATRVVSYANSIILFKKYPILGVGIGNSKYYMADIFLKSKLPMTEENIDGLYSSFRTKVMIFNEANLYESLSETGIIGTILLYFAIFRIYFICTKIQKIQSGIIYYFLKGFNLSYLFMMIVVSIYDSGYMFWTFWFYIGLAISIISLTKKDLIRGAKNE